jgi:tryptophanase
MCLPCEGTAVLAKQHRLNQSFVRSAHAAAGCPTPLSKKAAFQTIEVTRFMIASAPRASIKLDTINNILRIEVPRTLDEAGFLQMVEQTTTHAQATKCTRVLIDHSTATYQADKDHIAHRIAAVAPMLLPNTHVAVVFPEYNAAARLLEQEAIEANMVLAVFDSEYLAIDWLTQVAGQL